MTARIDELVLNSFRVDSEALRYLDAIVRQHCPNIDGTSSIKYKIQRNDALEYDTTDVEQVLRERNGRETRIESISLELDKPGSLTFSVDFTDEARIKGVSEDKAQLLLIASDVGRLMRDRMRGARIRRSILKTVAVAVAIIGYLGFQVFQATYVNRVTAQFSTQYGRLDAPYIRQSNALSASNQALIAQAESSLSKNDLKAEINFLVQQQLDQLRQQSITSREDQATKNVSAASPWWATSSWLPVAFAGVFTALVTGIGFLTLPGTISIFLIGDEIRRQERIEKRRRIISGIGSTVILGVLAGLIVASIT